MNSKPNDEGNGCLTVTLLPFLFWWFVIITSSEGSSWEPAFWSLFYYVSCVGLIILTAVIFSWLPKINFSFKRRMALALILPITGFYILTYFNQGAVHVIELNNRYRKVIKKIENMQRQKTFTSDSWLNASRPDTISSPFVVLEKGDTLLDGGSNEAIVNVSQQFKLPIANVKKIRNVIFVQKLYNKVWADVYGYGGVGTDAEVSIQWVFRVWVINYQTGRITKVGEFYGSNPRDESVIPAKSEEDKSLIEDDNIEISASDNNEFGSEPWDEVDKYIKNLVKEQ